MATTDVKINNNGPIIISGDFELKDASGNSYDLGGRTQLGLCRCGASANKPFCDGSHNRAGFQSSVEATALPPLKK